METGAIVIYQTEDGQTSIDVKLEQETIWLTQKQIAQLMDTEVPAISKHINNVFKTKELDKSATVSKMEIVQKEGARSVKRFVDHYNLDMIISVGYRVNSKRGTQFRIWANKILKEYLVKGYTVNEKRLKEQTAQLEELKQTVKLLDNVLQSQSLNSNEATGLLKVITDYTYALDVLDQYDHQVLKAGPVTKKAGFKITYKEAIKAIGELKNKFGGSALFGNEKDESFKSSLAAIYQTFDGKELYLGVEEKAAHLLYFVVKNHSFSDGNKRIAAFLFVWFLERNKLLYKEDGSRRLADNALVALTLMIAESKPEEMNTIVKVAVNLINRNN